MLPNRPTGSVSSAATPINFKHNKINNAYHHNHDVTKTNLNITKWCTDQASVFQLTVHVAMSSQDVYIAH